MKSRRARDSGGARGPVVTRPVGRVGVVGAGQMGSGIAAALVRSGVPTTLVDVSDAMLDAAVKTVRKVAADNPAERPERLVTATGPEVLADCDVVIEAITENEATKTTTYRNLAGILREGTILASNTSTIPISRMARAAADPYRFAGMHFFHPAHRMELVEVIRGERTSDETVATLVALAGELGKTPIVVRDCPGFLVTRVLFPYLSQALQLLQQGVAMEAIDEAAVSFGMPTGPIALLDFIGLDTALAISNVMAEGYPDRATTCPLLSELVGSGRLGRKSGAGFRSYDSPRPLPDPAVAPIPERHLIVRDTTGKDEITDRLFLPMLLESVRTLEEGIVRDPCDVDLGVVLGFGFPAARGGILRWCDAEGAASILERLGRLEGFGPWFQPTDTLRRMAVRGETFHARRADTGTSECRHPVS